MRAAIIEKYGDIDVLKVTDLPKPSPGKGEILIRNYATTVTTGDCELRRFDVADWIWLPLRLMIGVIKPRVNILGQDYSGVIEAIGTQVKRFKVGDRVMAPCDMNFGGYGEYVTLSANKPIIKIPDQLNYVEAATIPTWTLNALHLIRRANIQTGDSVLINGAGGSIGTFLIQLAKLKGAIVTAVDAKEKLNFLKELGADKVIDYKSVDIRSLTDQFDAVIDIVSTSDYAPLVNLVKKDGTLVIANPRMRSFVLAMKARLFRQKDLPAIVNALADYDQSDLEYIISLFESDELKIYVDRIFQLDEIRDAHKYVESQNKKGHVVIQI